MVRRTGLSIGAAAALAAAGLATSAGSARAGDPHEFELFLSQGPRLGITIDDVEAADVARLKLPAERGAVVEDVEIDSPGARAGLKEDDVIVAYQGETVLSAAQLRRMVRETPPGRKVALEVIRGGVTQKLSATVEGRSGHIADSGRVFAAPDLENLPDFEHLPGLEKMKDRLVLRGFGAERAPRKLGIEYQPISGQLAAYFHLKDPEGLLVSEVEEDGPAAKAGVKAGDVLLEVDGKPVRSSGDLQKAVTRLQPGAEVAVVVQRDGAPQTLKLTVAGRPERRRERNEGRAL